MLFDSEFETQIKFLASKSIAHSSLANELLTQCLEHRSCTTNAGLINELAIENTSKSLTTFCVSNYFRLQYTPVSCIPKPMQCSVPVTSSEILRVSWEGEIHR